MTARGVTLTEMEIRDHGRNHLYDALIPQMFQFVQSRPKPTGGKISRVG